MKRVSKQDMRQTELQRMILSMAGKYTAYKIFTDWIECTSLAVSNTLQQIHDKVWEKREKQYQAIMEEYTQEERAKFPELTAWLIEELEESGGGAPCDTVNDAIMYFEKILKGEHK